MRDKTPTIQEILRDEDSIEDLSLTALLNQAANHIDDLESRLYCKSELTEVECFATIMTALAAAGNTQVTPVTMRTLATKAVAAIDELKVHIKTLKEVRE